jgi:cytochrome c-type biogenesis protein
VLTDIGTYELAWLAGVVSTLSPCVLPIIPIILGAAANAHRFGPVALAAGLTLSFTSVGMLTATIGVAVGIDHSTPGIVAAWLFIAIGLVLLFDRLQEKIARAASGAGKLGVRWANSISGDRLSGQFVLGLVLGLAWSPCVGPTLGAAVMLANQGEDLAHAALVMFIFSIGANVPLVALSLLSKQTSTLLKGKLIAAGKAGRKILGVLMLAVGISVLTGLDKKIEAKLLELSPAWLTELTTDY